MSEYAVEMLGITKGFSGAIADDDVTLRVKRAKFTLLQVCLPKEAV